MTPHESLSEAERRLLNHFEDLLQKDQADEAVVVFDKAEIEVLKEWARFMMAWRTLGKWGASVRQVVLWFGIILGAIAAARVGLLDWLGIGGTR